jgi:hypothetical protein
MADDPGPMLKLRDFLVRLGDKPTGGIRRPSAMFSLSTSIFVFMIVRTANRGPCCRGIQTQWVVAPAGFVYLVSGKSKHAF